MQFHSLSYMSFVSVPVGSHTGSVYIRWGRTVCPTGTDLVYEGTINNKLIMSTYFKVYKIYNIGKKVSLCSMETIEIIR